MVRFKVFLSLGYIVLASSLFGEVSAVGPIELSVADLERETAFFREVLAFEVAARTEAEGFPA